MNEETEKLKKRLTKLERIGKKLLMFYEKNQNATTGDTGEFSVFDKQDDDLFDELKELLGKSEP